MLRLDELITLVPQGSDVSKEDSADSEADVQKRYYAQTAHHYDDMHASSKDEHYFALSVLVGLLDYLEIRSILDVGSGTGRAVAYLKDKCPKVRVLGLEPVRELREVGYSRGIPRADMIEGNALQLPFNAGDFDLVTEFGMLHHVKTPSRAVSEMLRVASKAIFVSDSNNFGQGLTLIRGVKRTLNFFGLWALANWVKTGGKGYSITEGDGLAFSYSVFSNYKQIRRACRHVHVMNTVGNGINPISSAGHVLLLGIK
jgi:SAM-dependent methyltransferase